MDKTRQTVMAPEAPLDSNVIWIDISSDEPIQKVFFNGEWRPIKDSDDNAEFATGEKVLDIGIEKTSATIPANSKLPTLGKVESLLDSKTDISSDEIIHPILVEGSVTATIDISENINKNLTIDVYEERNVDVIDLKNPDTDSDYVTTIRFMSSDTPTTITYVATELKWANEEIPIFEADAEYLIAIWKNIGIITKVSSIPLV